MSKQHFPAGWDEARVQRLIDHYESMSDDALIAEDEAAHKAGKDRLPPKVNGALGTKGTGRGKKGRKRKALSKGRKAKAVAGKLHRMRAKPASKG
jgi:hypothetical protein